MPCMENLSQSQLSRARVGRRRPTLGCPHKCCARAKLAAMLGPSPLDGRPHRARNSDLPLATAGASRRGEEAAGRRDGRAADDGAADGHHVRRVRAAHPARGGPGWRRALAAALLESVTPCVSALCDPGQREAALARLQRLHACRLNPRVAKRCCGRRTEPRALRIVCQRRQEEARESGRLTKGAQRLRMIMHRAALSVRRAACARATPPSLSPLRPTPPRGHLGSGASGSLLSMSAPQPAMGRRSHALCPAVPMPTSAMPCDAYLRPLRAGLPPAPARLLARPRHGLHLRRPSPDAPAPTACTRAEAATGGGATGALAGMLCDLGGGGAAADAAGAPSQSGCHKGLAEKGLPEASPGRGVAAWADRDEAAQGWAGAGQRGDLAGGPPAAA
eukprot:355736-Chlamydomonas_euryale.AAC.14